MQRMSGLDGQFLHFENAAETMHHLTLFVLRPDPAGGPTGPVSYAQVRAQVASRLDVLSTFRRRVVEVPYGLHHPVWIEDAGFDLDRHVHRTTVAAPGGPDEIAAAVVAVDETVMDRTIPLWQLVVLEGLAGGRTGVILKVHHAMCDGAGLLEIWRGLWQDEHTFDPSTFPGQGRPWAPEPVPDRRALLRDALSDHRRDLPKLPALTARTWRGRRAVRAHRRASTVRTPAQDGIPRTVLNRTVSTRRVWATTSFPLADVKAARAAVPGTTVNDVMLAVVGGALQRQLERRGGLPAQSLVASVPVGTDRTPTGRQHGNRVAYFTASLATDMRGGPARLRRIHEVATEAKTVLQLAGPTVLEEWVDHCVPFLVKGLKRTTDRFAVPEKVPPTTHLTFSNLPGPAARYRVAGIEVADIFVVGPVFDRAPLNITAMSYDGHVNVVVHADAATVPDAAGLAADLHLALHDLRPTDQGSTDKGPSAAGVAPAGPAAR